MSVGRAFKGKLSTHIPPHWPILLRTAKSTPTTSNHTILKFFFPCYFLVFPSLWIFPGPPSPTYGVSRTRTHTHTHTPPVSTVDPSNKRRNASAPKRHEESDLASSSFIVLDVSLAMTVVRARTRCLPFTPKMGCALSIRTGKEANAKRTT